MSKLFRRQQVGQQQKFTSNASTSARKTCRPSSGLRTMQRELCSTSVVSISLRTSTLEQTLASKPSSSASSTVEIHFTKRGLQTGRQIRQNSLWLWMRSVAADWEIVWRRSAFSATRLCLHLKCRRNYTRRAYHKFLWSMNIAIHFYRKFRMSSSNCFWDFWDNYIIV